MEEMNVMTYGEEIENTEVCEIHEEPEETTGNGGIGAIVLTTGAVIGGVAAILHFTKKKREAWAVKRLEKKGYVVRKSEEFETIDDVEYEDLDETK